MTRTGDREIRSVSGRLPDNPGELACMKVVNKEAVLDCPGDFLCAVICLIERDFSDISASRFVTHT